MIFLIALWLRISGWDYINDTYNEVSVDMHKLNKAKEFLPLMLEYGWWKN